MTALPHNDGYHGHVNRRLLRTNTSSITLNWGFIAAIVLNIVAWIFVARLLMNL
jgi:hypothetical protein